MVFRGEIWPIVEVLSTQNSVRRRRLPMTVKMMSTRFLHFTNCGHNAFASYISMQCKSLNITCMGPFLLVGQCPFKTSTRGKLWTQPHQGFVFCYQELSMRKMIWTIRKKILIRILNTNDGQKSESLSHTKSHKLSIRLVGGEQGGMNGEENNPWGWACLTFSFCDWREWILWEKVKVVLTTRFLNYIWSDNLQFPYTSKLEVYMRSDNFLMYNLQLPYK